MAWTRVCPRNHVLGENPDPLRERGDYFFLGGSPLAMRPVVKILF